MNKKKEKINIFHWQFFLMINDCLPFDLYVSSMEFLLKWAKDFSHTWVCTVAYVDILYSVLIVRVYVYNNVNCI